MTSKNYICPKCGPDKRGEVIHSLMFHCAKSHTEEEAKKKYADYLFRCMLVQITKLELKMENKFIR